MDKSCCVIVTFNIGNQLAKCFYSILNQVEKIIIIDNGSNNETIDYIMKLKRKYDIEVIFNKINKGIAFALNQGVDYALENNYKWILTMDNDSEATENMVSIMLNAYSNLDVNTRNKVVSLFPKYVEKGLEDNLKYISKYEELDVKFISNDITSGNLVKCDLFKKIGYYKSAFFIDCVDHEFCYRIVENKYKLMKINNAILLHSLGETKEKKFFGKKVIYTNHSALRKYYMTRNRFYLWKQYSNLKELNKLDKRNFIMENIKIVLFEKNKLHKFYMICRGYLDYKKGILGKYMER